MADTKLTRHTVLMADTKLTRHTVLMADRRTFPQHHRFGSTSEASQEVRGGHPETGCPLAGPGPPHTPRHHLAYHPGHLRGRV